MYAIVSRETAARAVRDLTRDVNDLLGLCQEVAGGVFFEADSLTMPHHAKKIRDRANQLADNMDACFKQQKEEAAKKAEEEAKKAAEEAAASGTEQPKENKVTKIASGFLGVVVLIALAAGGGFYAFTKQKQKKQAEKEALDPDANYTEDKGDFEIPVEDEPEEAGEEDTEPI